MNDPELAGWFVTPEGWRQIVKDATLELLEAEKAVHPGQRQTIAVRVLVEAATAMGDRWGLPGSTVQYPAGTPQQLCNELTGRFRATLDRYGVNYSDPLAQEALITLVRAVIDETLGVPL